jgi:phosphocarrier protein HPr
MLESTVTVVNRLGLHARAAAQLVKLAGRFRSKVTLVRVDNGVLADAKSILTVLMLAASVGTELRVQADGEDERQAVDEVAALFANRFGESI